MDYQPSDPSLAEILPAILALSPEDKKKIYEYLRVALRKELPNALPNPQVSSIGLFADEPDLADDIAREAMESRGRVVGSDS